MTTNQTLYDPRNEHDACGVGLVADLNNRASHSIVERGIRVLKHLMHRGATGNDPETGDGAGILVRIPDGFFRREVAGLPEAGRYGIAMVFGGKGEEWILEKAVRGEGGEVVAWREVPVDVSALGAVARRTMPAIRQAFVSCEGVEAGAAFERKLFVMRRVAEKEMREGYICSMSSRTIVYKGLMLATQVERFYKDLNDPAFVSPFALVHQRYSTNTFPTWALAHPFRHLAHNGEINTLRGNLNAFRMREPCLESPLFGEDLKKVLPLIKEGQSDSASLDNVFELLVATGRDPAHAMLMLMPQAWGAKYHMGHDARGFYEYHSALMEPWDGPAAVAFTDGTGAGAALDRNGLRPARWALTADGLFVLASEAGTLELPPGEVVRRGRLKPGSMVYLDLERHRLMEDEEIKSRYARRRPYRRWVAENRIPVQGLFTEIVPSRVEGDLAEEQARFGYTAEDLELILLPMARTGEEPVGSMGNDAALAALSKQRRSLFDYFHQLFAQVTNPPIDPIREELVTSLTTYIGNVGNILAETPEHARVVKLRRPVLTDDELGRLSKVGDRGFPSVTLPLGYAAEGGGAALREAVDALASGAVEAVKGGAKIVILSDRALPSEQAPVPPLLATAAVHRVLSEAGLRSSVGLVVQSGEVREVMHYALLLGYGATAVNPYLALESVSALCPEDPVAAAGNYIAAVDHGLLKTMSKMGISTLRSYRGAQIFEAVGLGRAVVEAYFPGTASRVGGAGLEEIAAAARRPRNPLGGQYRWRKGAEAHLWTPQALALFRRAVREDDAAAFKAYTKLIDPPSETPCTLRSLFRFRECTPVPLEEVEPAESIMRRFVGGAMSLGSLSPEAHETIARAFNSIGSMSNCGEGGENGERFGTELDCGIKQVASGRFGVTIRYLRAARDLQIKLAQGAKPGEGGRLPAHKVDEFIGRLRHARPGTTLISPPPHHDIYSIEDLAQLVYDLRCANPAARVSVKLVSEVGVGTVAAGVAKAHADVVLVSGFDGGTGAAPLTSVKHAGLPWELGLAEAQQTLVKNNLRGRVRLQVDGQLKTGRDIVVAALLGAEEFGFGTTLLVSLGCIQDRRCHCNTCPVGIATQQECLRKKFQGRPEHVVRFLRFLAEDVRGHLAALGLRSMDEATGRCDLLDTAPAAAAAGLDFSRLFAKEEGRDVRCDPAWHKPELENYDRAQLLPDPQVQAVLAGSAASCRLERSCSNMDRAVGTELSGEVAVRRGGEPLPEGSITVDFRGTGGQSFGAFLAEGITFNLRGETNDFLGKGLSGGILTVAPPEGAVLAPEDNVIAGNVIAYGATGGRIFLNGQAGERFAIRNSGAVLVAEGVGDHGCEYMTGGRVAVLGKTGVNFGAGMTGGVAYVLDAAGDFDLNCNLDSIDLFPVEAGSDDEAELLALLKEHIDRTGSPKAWRLLKSWDEARPRFVKVLPVRE